MRIGYLHLPRFPVQRCVRESPALAGRPLALVHETKGQKRVAFASTAALREGVRAGATLAAARALVPELLELPHCASAETAALTSLAEALLGISPGFMLSAPDGLWLDGSAAHLCGGESGWLERALRLCMDAGFRARGAVASELFTARALGRHGTRRIALVPPGRSAEALAPLPLAALEDSEALRSMLQSLGLQTLGEAAALPPASVVARLGAAGLRAQRLARGEDDRRLVPHLLPEVLEEARTLEVPGESLEPLLFALKGVVDRVCARLCGRQRAAVRLTLTLWVDPSGPHQVPLALARPTTSPRLLLDLFRHQLEAVRLAGPVTSVLLTVEESSEDRARQRVLGDGPEGDVALEAVLARLTTTLGAEALGSPSVHDAHRPEEVPECVPFHPPARERGLAADLFGPVRSPAPPTMAAHEMERPTRLLPTPVPLEAELGVAGEWLAARLDGSRRRVQAVAGPERLGGHWWTARPFQRDYYRVHLEGVGPAWVYRDATDGRMYLHGFFD